MTSQLGKAAARSQHRTNPGGSGGDIERRGGVGGGGGSGCGDGGGGGEGGGGGSHADGGRNRNHGGTGADCGETRETVDMWAFVLRLTSVYVCDGVYLALICRGTRNDVSQTPLALHSY